MDPNQQYENLAAESKANPQNDNRVIEKSRRFSKLHLAIAALVLSGIGIFLFVVIFASESQWVKVSEDNAPSKRTEHTAIWTGSSGNPATSNKMIIWGGNCFLYCFLGDGGIYDPSSDSWSTISATGAPAARSRHIAVWTGDTGNNTANRMIIWGGFSRDSNNLLSYTNTGGMYDPISGNWKTISTEGAPLPRSSAYAVWTGATGDPSTANKMIVWSGWNNVEGGVLDDGGIYDPLTDTWESIPESQTVKGRLGAAFAWTGSELLIWGGATESFAQQVTGTGARYNPATKNWSSISEFRPSTGHGFAWTGSRLLVWGGYNAGYQNSGGVYDLNTDQWNDISGQGIKDTYFPTMVWADNRMVLVDQCEARTYEPTQNTWGSLDDLLVRKVNETGIWNGYSTILWGGWEVWPENGPSNTGFYHLGNTAGEPRSVGQTSSEISNPGQLKSEEIGDTYVGLTWSPSTVMGISRRDLCKATDIKIRYEVYRKKVTPLQSEYELIGLTDTPMFNDTTAERVTDYKYYVAAKASAAGIVPKNSNELSVRTKIVCTVGSAKELRDQCVGVPSAGSLLD